MSCLKGFLFIYFLHLSSKIEPILRCSFSSNRLGNGFWPAADPFALEELHFEETSAGEWSFSLKFSFCDSINKHCSRPI